MGRIKSLMVKRAARQLLTTENVFNESFEDNKKTIGNNTMPSKSTRNKIAGYIARIKKMQRKLKAAAAKPKVVEMPQEENQLQYA